MKKLIITALVCALTIIFVAVPVSAATVNTNQLFIPQVSTADGNFSAGKAFFVGGAEAQPYWVGENTTGAFTFGNWWRSHTDRNMPTTQVSEVSVVFKIPVGASEGDTLAFNSTLTLQYYSGAKLEVDLVAYNEEGYFGNLYHVFDGVASRTTELSFTTFIDQLHYNLVSHAPADFFYLMVTVSGLENGSGANLKNGIWFQFSKDSTFTAGSGANAPIYDAPDDSTLNDYNSAEDGLLEDTEAGAEEMSNIFNNFGTTLSTFAEGIMAATAIFGVFAEIPEFYGILFVSLGIGILTFLFGVGQIGLSTAQEYSRVHPYSPLMSPDGGRHKDYSADEKWLL